MAVPRIYKDGKWEDVVYGVKGEKGDRGEKGERGPPGLGIPGIDGDPGINGTPGDKGDKGDTGDRGPKGDQGPQGIQGKPGVNGKDGKDGQDADPIDESKFALKVSPHLEGEPTAPTPGKRDKSQRIATTEFVKRLVDEIPKSSSGGGYIGGGGGGSITGASKLSELTDVTLSSPAAGELLSYDGSKWVNGAAPSGSGDVTGPSGATADDIAVFSGATGKIIKDSSTKIADLAPIASPTFTGVVTASTLDTGVAAAGVTLTGTTLAADGTDAAIDINITPKGTGEVNLPKVDIDAGTIDAVTIAATTALKFGLTPTVVGTPDNGSIYWKATEETPTIQLHANVALPIGQKELRMVYNPSVSDTIPRGAAVYTNGIGGTPTIVTVALAQANATSTSMVLGLAAEDILPETQGFVVVRGHLGELDTSAFDGAAGASLYLSDTVPGGVTTIVPDAPNLEIRVGRLIVKNASGKVNVRINQSYSLDNLTDVQVPAPVSGQLLKFDGVSWVAADSAVVSSAGGTDLYLDDTDEDIEGMTRAAACVVTWTGHGLATGSYVKFEGITQTGWTALNSPSGAANVFHKITYINVNSFSIPVNTSGYAGDYVPATDPGTISTGKLINAPNTALATQTDSAQSTGNVEALIDTYSTALPLGTTAIAGGEWAFKTWCYASSATDTNIVVIRVYKREADGTETELFNVSTADLSVTNTLSQIASVQPAFTILATDYLVFKYFAKSNRGGGNTRILYITHNGSTNYTYVKTPISLSHNNLIGLEGGGAGAYYHLIAPVAPAAGLLNVIGIANGETTRTHKAIFDTTNPEMNGTAGPGTQIIAARRDHVHASDTSRAPSNPLATDTLWDAAGDLVIGTGANTAGKLTKGSEGKVLTAGATTVSWETPAAGAAALDDLTDVTISSVERGDVLFRDATGWINLHHGDSGDVLTSGGNAADVSWEPPTGGAGADLNAQKIAWLGV